MEELRDERLAKIITWFQAWIRAYIARKEYKKLQDQRRVSEHILKIITGVFFWTLTD
jgi:myosin heavy subunit